MAVVVIPIKQGIANYRLSTQLLGVSYLFDFAWNAYDQSWWLSVYDAQENPIRVGIKCVLGAFLGRTCLFPPFSQGALIVYDTSGSGLDAGFNDFGSRIKMAFLPTVDLIAYEQNPTAFGDKVPTT